MSRGFGALLFLTGLFTLFFTCEAVKFGASAHGGDGFYQRAFGVSILAAFRHGLLGMIGGALAWLQVAAGSSLLRRQRAFGAAEYARSLVAGLAMVFYIPLIIWLCISGAL